MYLNTFCVVIKYIIVKINKLQRHWNGEGRARTRKYLSDFRQYRLQRVEYVLRTY